MAIDTTPTPTPAPVAEQQAAPRLSARDRLILFVLCAAQFMVALDFSVLNVALPVLGADLGMSTSALQWAVTAFALPSGGFLLLFGRMGDLYGRRRLFLAGLRTAVADHGTAAWLRTREGPLGMERAGRRSASMLRAVPLGCQDAQQSWERPLCAPGG